MHRIVHMKERLEGEVKEWWIGIDRTTPNPTWTIYLDLKEDLSPLVNGRGRRWMLVEHIPDRWRSD